VETWLVSIIGGCPDKSMEEVITEPASTPFPLFGLRTTPVVSIVLLTPSLTLSATVPILVHDFSELGKAPVVAIPVPIVPVAIVDTVSLILVTVDVPAPAPDPIPCCQARMVLAAAAAAALSLSSSFLGESLTRSLPFALAMGKFIGVLIKDGLIITDEEDIGASDCCAEESARIRCFC